MEEMTSATPLNVVRPVTDFFGNQTELLDNQTGQPFVASNETFSNSGVNSAIKTFQSIVLPTIYSIVCIIGLIGNGLVIYIMHLKVRNRNITDLYVLNLAIADFIFVAMLPFWTTDIALNKRWVFGKFFCKFTSGSTYFHMYASVFFLTAMSVDRFLAVVMYQSCRRTKTRATIGVIVIWLISTVLGLLPMFFRDVTMNKYTGQPSCDWTFDENISSHASWLLTYFISRSILGFAIPFLIILVSYSMIIIFLKTRETRGKLTSKCQDRATKMVLVVIGVFLLCWLPNQISNLVYVAQSLRIMSIPSDPMPHYYIHMFSTCLAWMHSCINPILYAFMREDMRVKLTEILNHNIKRCCGDRYQRDGGTMLNEQNKSLRRKLSEANKEKRGSIKSAGKRPSRSSITESVRLTTIGGRSPNDDLEEEDALVQSGTKFNYPASDENSVTAYDGGGIGTSHALQRGCLPSPILEESRSRSTECDTIKDGEDAIRDSDCVTKEDDDTKESVMVHDDQEGATTYLGSEADDVNLL